MGSEQWKGVGSFAHDGVVVGVTLSKNEQRMLTWSTDRVVQIWSVADKKSLAQLIHSGDVIGACFSPDENQVLLWSYEGGLVMD